MKLHADWGPESKDFPELKKTTSDQMSEPGLLGFKFTQVSLFHLDY